MNNTPNESPLTVWTNDLPSDITVEKFHDDDHNLLLRFSYKDSNAVVNCDCDKKGLWATVYWLKQINGFDKGQAIYLLNALKEHYIKHNYDFAFSYADTTLMKHVLYLCKIQERCETQIAKE